MTDHDPLIWRLAHKLPGAYIALACLYPLSALIPDTVLSWIAWVILLVVEGLTLIPFIRHQRSLCGICASMTPLQGAEAAQKKLRQLNLFHNQGFRIYGIVPLIPAVVLTIWLDLPPYAMRLAVSFCLINSALIFQAAITHRLLQPWCPHCRRRRRWEDGGRPEPSPPLTPPTDTGTRT